MQLDYNSREMLLEILQKRQIEARRNDMARAAKKSIKDYHLGKTKPLTVDETIDRLNTLAWPTFGKSYQKFASKNPLLKTAIAKALRELTYDAFEPSLRTHKLSGKLALYFACSCGYDCRIVFTIEKDPVDPGNEYILLLDIGTHQDVYWNATKKSP